MCVVRHLSSFVIYIYSFEAVIYINLRVVKEGLTREQLGEEIGIFVEGSSNNNNYVSMVTIENNKEEKNDDDGACGGGRRDDADNITQEKDTDDNAAGIMA